MELILRKQPGGHLSAADDESAEALLKVKVGAFLRCKITRMRKIEWHRRFFKLIGFAYDLWSETVPKMEYRGQEVQPNKTRFRKDLTILAGYYDASVRLNGEVRVEAKSISFDNMGQDEFEALYSASINAILLHVLTKHGLTDEKIRNAVDELMRFDS